MKKFIALQATLFILFCSVTLSWGQQAVSEEARRHMARGEAAVEMAKSSEDYEAAIKEFQEAARLVPYWADPYYKLGLVQEKAGKLREAIASLNRYLQLAPNAPDASKIKELIYKLEFKAEQIVTDEDALSIFASLTDKTQWKLIPSKPADKLEFYIFITAIQRNGEDLLISYMERVDDAGKSKIRIQRVTPVGRFLEFRTIYYLCTPSIQRDECPEVFKYSLEVVSKREVRMNVRIFFPEIAGNVKAYVDDKALKFVKR